MFYFGGFCLYKKFLSIKSLDEETEDSAGAL